jgi:hypothetical protein
MLHSLSSILDMCTRNRILQKLNCTEVDTTQLRKLSQTYRRLSGTSVPNWYQPCCDDPIFWNRNKIDPTCFYVRTCKQLLEIFCTHSCKWYRYLSTTTVFVRDPYVGGIVAGAWHSSIYLTHPHDPCAGGCTLLYLSLIPMIHEQVVALSYIFQSSPYSVCRWWHSSTSVWSS